MADWNDGHGGTELTSNLPAPAPGNDQLTELRFREPGVNLHAEEPVRVPEEFEIVIRVFSHEFLVLPITHSFARHLKITNNSWPSLVKWTRLGRAQKTPSDACRHARSQNP